MKVTTETPKPEFTPRSITITFESQAELDAWACLFVTTAINRAICNTFGVKYPELWVDLQKLGGDTSRQWQKLENALREEFRS